MSDDLIVSSSVWAYNTSVSSLCIWFYCFVKYPVKSSAVLSILLSFLDAHTFKSWVFLHGPLWKNSNSFLWSYSFLLSRVLHFLSHISNNRMFISPFLGFSVLDLICWPPWKIKESSLSQLPPLVHTQTDTQTCPISLFFNCDETNIQCLPSYVYTNNIYMGATQLAIISSPVVHKCFIWI